MKVEGDFVSLVLSVFLGVGRTMEEMLEYIQRHELMISVPPGLDSRSSRIVESDLLFSACILSTKY